MRQSASLLPTSVPAPAPVRAKSPCGSAARERSVRKEMTSLPIPTRCVFCDSVGTVSLAASTKHSGVFHCWRCQRCERVWPLSADEQQARDRPTSGTAPLLTVRRRCVVCDFIEEMTEAVEQDLCGPRCTRCNGPTERIEALSKQSRSHESNPHAAALGRLGGLKGGPARAAALSAKRRREIAQAAARARWCKRPR